MCIYVHLCVVVSRRRSMYVSLSRYIYIHTYTYIHTYVHTYIHNDIRIHIHILSHMHIYTHIYIYILTSICSHPSMVSLKPTAPQVSSAGSSTVATSRCSWLPAPGLRQLCFRAFRVRGFQESIACLHFQCPGFVSLACKFRGYPLPCSPADAARPWALDAFGAPVSSSLEHMGMRRL